MNMIRRIMSKEEQLLLAAFINAERRQKLNELEHMIRGTSYAGPERERTKGASASGTGAGSVNNNNNSKPKITLRLRPILSEKQKKLKELGKMIRND